MGYTPYKTMVLIPDGNPITFQDVLNTLQAKFSHLPDVNVILETPGAIAVRHGGWSLHVYWEDQPHVVIESGEIAERFVSDEADRAAVSTCRARITTAGDPDPAMTYFNDYVFVLEELEKIPGVYLFDADSREVRRTGP